MSEIPNRPQSLGKPSERRVIAALIAAGILSAIGGFLVYAETATETTGRKIAESIIQLAFVAFIGSGLAYLIQQSQASNERRRQEEAETVQREQADRDKRIDFLRRLRAIHERVEYARALTRAHNTGSSSHEN